MTNFGMKCNGLLGGSLPWSFGLWFSGNITEAQAQSLWSGAITTMFSATTPPGLNSIFSADVTVTGTSSSTLNATMHQTTKTSTGAAFTGTDTNPSLPWHVAEVVTLRTGQATKSGHGRFFLPPMAEDKVTAHVITTATITQIVNSVNAMFVAMVGGGMTPFIFNKRALKDGTPAFTIKNVTSFDVPNKPYQQRRRVSKVVPARTTGAI